MTEIMFLKSFLEITMLICFGAAWPISIYKSWTSRSSKGKSLLFLLVIIVGYLAGIGKCLLDGATHWSVVALYVVNVTMVSIDMLLYFRNEAFEKKTAEIR
ncbi:MAG: hypothetical protein SOY64_02330 [Pyramidobacter sp.]|uniref:hypothetical protein n=1 Tax=Pyramidobacter sp. TaxID=1943581 RepID=UPI002A801D69|nr:hypothetical protein [Pyramidobacter sp.]MDY4031893.1 hypothetical protein [Pyramidobacter sp.]